MMNKNKKNYKTGKKDLDKIIADLARMSFSVNNADLIEEMHKRRIEKIKSIENDNL
jgi:hypothetical protein